MGLNHEQDTARVMVYLKYAFEWFMNLAQPETDSSV
jgi:hypothetical protein